VEEKWLVGIKAAGRRGHARYEELLSEGVSTNEHGRQSTNLRCDSEIFFTRRTRVSRPRTSGEGYGASLLGDFPARTMMDFAKTESQGKRREILFNTRLPLVFAAEKD